MSDNESESAPNVHQRLLAVIDELGALAKEGKADSRMGGFGYHKIDDVVDALRPVLVKHRVLPLVSVVAHEGHDVEVQRRSGDAGTDRFDTCTLEVVFVNVDSPEDRTEPVRSFGDGYDTSDKAAGKACAYALKNLLLAQFQLRGQPDNEGEGSGERDGQRRAPQGGGTGWRGEGGGAQRQTVAGQGSTSREDDELTKKVKSILAQGSRGDHTVAAEVWKTIGERSKNLREDHGTNLRTIQPQQVKVFYGKASGAGVDPELMKRYVYRYTGIDPTKGDGDHLQLVPASVVNAVFAAIDGGAVVKREEQT